MVALLFSQLYVSLFLSPSPSRLETHTKESNTHVSGKVANLRYTRHSSTTVTLSGRILVAGTLRRRLLTCWETFRYRGTSLIRNSSPPRTTAGP